MVCFTPSKCKILFQEWSALTLRLVIRSEVIDCINYPTEFESLISPAGVVPNKISTRILKAPFAQPTYVTCSIGEISVYQVKSKYSSQ